MLIVTTNDIPGLEIGETLGQAFGLVVRSRGLGGNLAASLRSLVGGEIVEYTQMLEEARRHAIDRLSENAGLMGADAIVGMRFDSSELGDTMTEVVAYGTAVRLVERRARAPEPHRVAEPYHPAEPAPPPSSAFAPPPAPGGFGQRRHVP